MSDLVTFRVGEAVAALREVEGPFNLVFNDIDKDGYVASLPVIKSRLRSGGVLIVDNLLWSGRIFDESDTSASTVGIREFTRRVTSDPEWVASIVPIGTACLSHSSWVRQALLSRSFNNDNLLPTLPKPMLLCMATATR